VTLDCFDRIRVINLAERRDRRREMERELAAISLAVDPRVSFFPAIRPADASDFTSVGARGVYLGQLAILREAAAANESVLILEDDCTFEPTTNDYSADGDWEIFYGGYEAANPDDLVNSDIIGAHMMGFTAAGAKAVVAYLDALTYEGIHPPIDAAYIWFRRAHPEVITRFAIPPLAHQRSSRSDIAPRFFDRMLGMREAAEFARRIKRALSRQ
jgi:glycosyl transferase family 25